MKILATTFFAFFASGLNAQPSQTPDLIVYDDALSFPWINASWSATVDFGSTEQTQSSTSAIKVSLSSAWGALSLHHGNWGSPGVNSGSYQSFDFFVYSPSSATTLSVFFESDQGQSFPQVNTGPIAADAWVPVSIPTGQLNPNNLTVNRIAIQDISGQRRTFYVDGVRFKASTPQIPPDTPVLVSPFSGESVSSDPKFIWRRSFGATSYRVQVSSESDFSSTVADQGDLSDTSYSLNGLPVNYRFWWRVNAANEHGTSEWSTPRDFATSLPDALPQAPEDGSTGLASNPTLFWGGSVIGEGTYRLQVSTTANFSALFLDQENISETRYSLVGLEEGTTYYWRVSATDYRGTGTLSYTWNFTTAGSNLPMGWEHLSGVSSGELSGASFVDGKIGTIVGGREILRTSDGGATWVSQSSGTTEFILGVCFIDANTGTAVGSGGTIIRTTNGGATWLSQPSETSAYLLGVSFTDANTGTVVGDQGTILRTTNGGSTWTSQSSGTLDWLLEVSFRDPNTGMAVGNGGIILKTTDGGITWTSLSSGTTENLWGVSVSDVQNATVVGELGTILRTVDGGLTWVSQPSGTYLPLYAVQFLDTGTGLAVGYKGTILRTTDGGENWVKQWSGTTSYLLAVSFSDPQRGTVVGEGGTILRTTDGGTGIGAPPSVVSLASPANGTGDVRTTPEFTWNKAEGAETYRLQLSTSSNFTSNIVDNGSLTDTTFTSGSLANLTTYYWRVSASNQYGTSEWSETWSFTTTSDWMRASSGTANLLHSVDFIDSTKGIAVGENGVILRTTDGGNSWETIYSGVTTNLYGVSFVGTETGTAVGAEGIILRTTDGGDSWMSQSSGTTYGLAEVSFSSPQAGIAIGESGTILRTTNGGSTWTQQTSGTSHHLYGVHYVNDNFAIVVGGLPAYPPSRGKRCILRTTDGGQTWNNRIGFSYESQPWFVSVHFTDAKIGFAVGGGGTIERTTDGGLSWTHQTSTVNVTMNDIFLADASTATAIGENGTIVRTTNGGSSWINSPSGINSNLYAISAFSSTASDTWVVSGAAGLILKRTIFPEPAPGSPMLSSPIQGEANVSITPVLHWSPASDAVLYHLQVSASPDFSSLSVDRRLYGQLSFSMGGTANGTTHYWRVRSENSSGFSPWSSVGTFTVRVAPGGWQSNSSGITNDLWGVYCADAENAVAVGEGIIIRTTDGGNTWNAVLNDPNSFFAGLTFTNSLTGFAAGVGVLKTTDAGATWQPTSLNPDYALFLDIDFADEMNGTAVGTEGWSTFAIVHTSNGGSTWDVPTIDNAFGRELRGVSFGDSLTGVAVGIYGSALRTTDGGASWANVTLPEWVTQAKVDLADDNTGIGIGSAIQRTTDGGTTWTKVADLRPYPADLWLVNGNQGHMVGEEGSIIHSIDAFNTWNLQATGTDNILTGVSFASESIGYVVGKGGIILKTTTGGYSSPSVPLLASPPYDAAELPDNLTIIWHSSSGAVSYQVQVSADSTFSDFLVNEEGFRDTSFVLADLDSATTYYWRVNATNPAANSDWSGVWRFSTISRPPDAPVLASPPNGGINESLNPYFRWRAVTGADFYRVQVSADSGFTTLIANVDSIPTTTFKVFGLSNATSYYWRVHSINTYGRGEWSPTWSYTTEALYQPGWTLQMSGTSQNLNDVHFMDDRTGIIVGDNGVILRTTNGGIDWIPENSGTTTRLVAVRLANEDQAWAVGNNGLILHTKDRGESWVPQNSTVSQHLYGVEFTGDLAGIAVGGPSLGGWSSSVLLRTNDAGNTWSRVSLSSYPLFAVDFVSPEVGWATGRFGTIIKTTNGGLNWISQNSTSYYLHTVSFADIVHGWAMEGSGVALRTVNGGSQWTVQQTGAARTTADIWALGPSTAMIVGAGGLIMLTTDGGATWLEKQSGTSEYLNAVMFSDSVTGIIVGQNGLILKTKNRGELPPPPPLLASPSNGATGVATTPTLRWHPVRGGLSYGLQISADSGFASLIVEQDGISDTSFVADTLSHGTVYYWRVNAASDIKSGEWSAEWRFRTKSAFLPDLLVYSDALQSPWINASWSASVTFGNTEQTFQSSSSIKTALTSAWGALSLHHNNWGTPGVTTANYRSLDFAVHPLANESRYSIFFENDQGQSFPKPATGPVPPNTWTPISIPISQLNPSGFVVNRIAIQDISGQRQTYYVDSLRFSGAAINASAVNGTSQTIVEIPTEFGLWQNYPNPFNPTTTIRYGLPEDSDVSLEIYNVLGQRVQTLVDAHQKAGYYEFRFQGSGIASGVYFYRMTASPTSGNVAPFVRIKKMFLVK